MRESQLAKVVLKQKERLEPKEEFQWMEVLID